ncbi:Riboflavin synthase [bioreactor metagenome]|uniref:Riboflavin synthase n=1 Tax=bioreactor metagenome TaxID=1076179 RepID=A0A644XNU7_9ZZZZ
MFTGLIEEIGLVLQNIPAAGTLSFRAKTVLEGMRLGDSVAVNGVCLTVTGFDERSFTADVTPETLRRSALGRLHSGDKVNLERPVAANGRFGGHFVSGHIDGTGSIARRKKEGISVVIGIKAPPEIMNLVVEKGSIAIDGISLTVAKADHETFEVSIIPHTGSQTTLTSKSVGDIVNLETDLIGKYVKKFVQGKPGTAKITLDFLQQNGF